MSEPYREYHRDDNLRVHWADADLGIPWPDPEPILSDLARGAPSLAEVLAASPVS